MIKAEVSKLVLLEVRDQIFFEIIRALTRTARDAVAAIKSEMPRKFILRRDWAVKGVRYDAATKEKPVARVYSTDSWMTKQEEGETYISSRGRVAIPAGIRNSEKEEIPRSEYPRKLWGKKGIFEASFADRKSGRLAGMEGIFQRTDDNKSLKILYLLKKEKKTEKRWNFETSVEQTVNRVFESHLK